jgi:site-specific recombinase XerD
LLAGGIFILVIPSEKKRALRLRFGASGGLQSAMCTPSFLIYQQKEVICMADFDVHKINRRMEQALEKLEECNVSDEDKRLILEFRDDAISKGLTKTRILKYINVLQKLSELLEVSFIRAEKKDLLRLLRNVESSGYSEWTKHDYKVIIKRFYKWLNGGEEYPEKVKWIKTTFNSRNKKLPEDLLTCEDVKKIINAADHIRDKALVSLLYESGCRISEILTMRIKSVNFDKYGAMIVVSGKKGPRRIPVVSSVPYLAAWHEIHPLRDNREAPLWVSIGTRGRNEVIEYQNTRQLIARLAKKAGVKKKVNPHIFRHSRATYLANHFTEAQMNHYFGWI